MSKQVYPTLQKEGRPNILYRDDDFLSLDEIRVYQSLLNNDRWALSEGNPFDRLFYISQGLYRHYAWDGDWDAARWLDSTPVEWENLYNKISKHLPAHYIHWCDVKMTGPLQGGTPIHRDKDPWTVGGDSDRFSRAISIICNLNTAWNSEWGGSLILYETKIIDGKFKHVPVETVPVSPGQLLIMENCVHSVESITEPSRCRISFILHVLEYKNHDPN